MKIEPDFEELLRLLNKYKVRAINLVKNLTLVFVQRFLFLMFF